MRRKTPRPEFKELDELKKEPNPYAGITYVPMIDMYTVAAKPSIRTTTLEEAITLRDATNYS